MVIVRPLRHEVALKPKQWQLRACPRCSGDLYLDLRGVWYRTCLQCGYEVKAEGQLKSGQLKYGYADKR